MGDLEPGQHRVVYLATFGSELHLRIRRFPYPGGEAVLWHGRGDARDTFCVPSPSFRYVAMLLRGSPPVGPMQVLVIPMDGSEAKTVAPAESTDRWSVPDVVFWRDDDTLEMMVRTSDRRARLARWVYTVGTEEPEFVGDFSGFEDAVESFLETHFREEAEAVEKAGRHPETDPQMARELPRQGRSVAILRLEGTATWSERYGLSMSHAVSPDGEYRAMRRRRKPTVVTALGDLDTIGTAVGHPLPRTDLLLSESVGERDLCWSPDSKFLTFTEMHHHPARFHAFDIGGDVSKPWDTTYLVRLYSVETKEVKTIALGSNAFLLPDDLSWEVEASSQKGDE